MRYEPAILGMLYDYSDELNDKYLILGIKGKYILIDESLTEVLNNIARYTRIIDENNDAYAIWIETVNLEIYVFYIELGRLIRLNDNSLYAYTIGEFDCYLSKEVESASNIRLIIIDKRNANIIYSSKVGVVLPAGRHRVTHPNKPVIYVTNPSNKVDSIVVVFEDGTIQRLFEN